MSVAKKKIVSVALTLCLTVVMFAGLIVAMPAPVKAAGTYDLSDYFNADGTVSATGAALPVDVVPRLYLSYGDSLTVGANTYYATQNTDIPIHSIAASLSATLAQWDTWLASYPGISTTAPPPLPPAPASSGASGDYAGRHEAFWYPIHAQLITLGNTGSMTVDTAGHDLEFVHYLVFEALKDTQRTLTIRHEDESYRINGANMASIILGQNHLFYGNLDGFRI